MVVALYRSKLTEAVEEMLKANEVSSHFLPLFYILVFLFLEGAGGIRRC